MNNTRHTLNIKEIIKLIPHRYPFLLVDQVIEFQSRKYLKAIKNVSFNESFFQGHFPGKPILPGVLILESMAQAIGILIFKSFGKLNPKEIFYLTGIDHARFKHPVVPGDRMVIRVTFNKMKKHLIKSFGITTIENKLVCEAKISCIRSINYEE